MTISEVNDEKRDLMRVVGWCCVVLGLAQGIYQLNWALLLPTLAEPFAASYFVCSVICFVAVGIGVYLLCSESPNSSLLGWVLFLCFGIALIGEGLYMSARYSSELSLYAWIHLARNITLDLWLPFAAALLAIASERTYPRLLLFAMFWWFVVDSLFYWGMQPTSFTGCLMVGVGIATAGALLSALYQDQPSAWMLLSASVLWIALLVYTVLRTIWADLLGAITHPIGAASRLTNTLMWPIGVLNDWVYNSAPFWLFMVLHRRLFWG